MNPAWRYERITDGNIDPYVRDRFDNRISNLFQSLDDPILKADFLRYLILLKEGGVWADIDVYPHRPIARWIPEQYRDRVNLVVGIGNDHKKAKIWPGSPYHVQLCQYTVLAKPGRPAIGALVEQVAKNLEELAASKAEGAPITFEGVMSSTGPFASTKVMMEYFTRVTGVKHTGDELESLQEARLIGDVLVLPKDAFGWLPQDHTHPKGDSMILRRCEMDAAGFLVDHPTHKRKRLEIDDRDARPIPPQKRRRRVNVPVPVPVPARTGPDLLSPLSDELLLRILSFLPLCHLLAVLPVSRRFYHLASDSQLWKALYYARFVLPRARKIAGFRECFSSSGAYRRRKWALWMERAGAKSPIPNAFSWVSRDDALSWVAPEDVDQLAMREETSRKRETVNWKKQYKLRYNWVMGKCVVGELGLGAAGDKLDSWKRPSMTLAKLVEGFAITADDVCGLRVWDLKDRRLLKREALFAAPRCMDIDDARSNNGKLDIALGFANGSFGVWRLCTKDKRLVERYRHQKADNKALVSISYSHPYLMTATSSVVTSIYTFEVPRQKEQSAGANTGIHGAKPSNASAGGGTDHNKGEQDLLPVPYLLTSLNSQTSRPPLSCSIRQTATVVIASIAYTISTLHGWSVGIQDLHISPSKVPGAAPDVGRTRVATAHHSTGSNMPLHSSLRNRMAARFPETVSSAGVPYPSPSMVVSSNPPPPPRPSDGPKTLCYSHPYLLVTLPDNTLSWHTCTSDPSTLEISRGVPLFGHTSGVGVAEITNRGKAVSVSVRGDEIRVWELEGRVGDATTTESVTIQAVRPPSESESDTDEGFWNERRNWVGFDEEMVIVLREKMGGGGESLLVYDFT
ncbi:hypothetical protein OQA88_4586 [Cercophora sp. LCS_1]